MDQLGKGPSVPKKKKGGSLGPREQKCATADGKTIARRHAEWGVSEEIRKGRNC